MKEKRKLLIHVFVLIIVGTIFFSCKNYPKKTAIATTTRATKSYFLFLSDVHLYVEPKSNHSKNDTDTTLWNNCKKKLDSILGSQNPPRFVLCTGDLPAHDEDCKDSLSCYIGNGMDRYKWHNDNIKKVLTDLRQLVAARNIPLFYVPGNNDGLAGDYFSFSDEKKQTPFSLVDESTNPFPALNVSANQDSAAHTVSMDNVNMGYFSATAMKGLRIVGLNTVIWGNTYYAINGVSQSEAGNAEIKWLGAQLKDAFDKSEKVYLLMHIPPGIDAYKADSINKKKPPFTMWAEHQSWLNDFLRLNDQYKTSIAGIFFGHTHLDELRLLYDSMGKQITQVAISAPGIAHDHGNNPAFKIVEFNAVDKSVTDFTTYYSNKKATVWGNGTYRFSDVFGCASGTSILDCLKQQPITEINKHMDSIYTSKNGGPSYNTGTGMVVKWVK